MTGAAWRAILALPFNVLVVVPALLLAATRSGSLDWRLSPPGELSFWLALASVAAGLTLMAATIRLFDRVGRGTLAPWNPTRRLVVAGPYRYVRNPMISGVLLVLLGESLLFGSIALAGWAAVFAAGNTLYFAWSEEPGLERRFGDEYRRYRSHVPRWLPRLRPWTPGDDG